MASVGPISAGFKQSGGYFVPLANLTDGKILAYTAGSGAGGSYLPGRFAAAGWATVGTANASPYTSTITGPAAGGLLRDMGKTVVSASRTFRKVQLVTNAVSTGGVGGQAGTVAPAGPDYLTGYIELSSGRNGSAGTSAAPVAYYPSLM